MASESAVIGPGWTSANDGRFAGRYPLAVERHALAQVGRLVPGVTTVTPHARYYSLHALVSSEAQRLRWSAEEARRKLRRCEVVLAGVSIAHADPHPGMARAHGSERIATSMDEAGELDVDGLARPAVYAQADWGFWAPYSASEGLLGLVDWVDGTLAPGPNVTSSAWREGLGDIFALADRNTVSMGELQNHRHLCLCQGALAADGEALRALLIPRDAQPTEHGGRRAQTVKMMMRLYELHPEPSRPQPDLAPLLLFGENARNDDVLGALDITPAWIGVALRAMSVAAWRDLWAWLVEKIEGRISIAGLGAVMAEHLPSGVTVGAYMENLPDRGRFDTGATVLPAETEVLQRNVPENFLSILMLGSMRGPELPRKVRAYFEGPHDLQERLTPTWLAGRLDDWRDQPLRDFAIFLTEQLVFRSQHIALDKSTFSQAEGRLRIPTRVFVRDGQVFSSMREPGGGISLRWTTLTTVLAGVGMLEHRDGIWHVTELGASL